MKKIVISIEGNIGVGKSSLLNELKKEYAHSADFIMEPVEEWISIKNHDDKNILELFYEDKKRWSYTFQNIAYITRMKKIVDILLNSNKRYIIMDRSLDADLNTFATLLYKEKILDSLEWDAYNKWNNFFGSTYGHMFEHIYVYLRCDPIVSKERIKKRGRIEEKNIDIEYLKGVSDCHDDWLLDKKMKNVIVIDVNEDFIDNKENYKHILEKINSVCS